MKPNFWREFPRQADVEAAIRAVVNPRHFHQSFESPLISDLVQERHYFCRLHGLRPSAFKKTPENTPYRFYGLFASHGWHPVSWRKCLTPPPSREAIIVAAFRKRIEEEKMAFRRANPLCAHCGKAPSEETHHAEPTFKEITERVFAATSGPEIDSAIAAWNWFVKEDFVVPEGHVIAQRFDAMHATARLEALCRECHKATNSRKPTTRSHEATP